MTDYVLGIAENLSPRNVETWATSLVNTGFRGVIVLFASEDYTDLKRLCDQLGMLFAPVPRHELPQRVNKERWLYYVGYLDHWLNPKPTDRLVATDVRDVYFQSNPSLWLDLRLGDNQVVTTTEGITYEDEWWNKEHALAVYGQSFYERHLRRSTVVNSGVVAGLREPFRELCLLVYQDTQIAPSDTSDQIALNGVLAKFGARWKTWNTTHDHGWCCHGAIMGSNLPSIVSKRIGSPPQLIDDEVCDPSGEPYAIVHQYDRVASWQKLATQSLDRRPGP